LLGVAIGTAVPIFVANVFVLAPAACRQLDVRMTDFIRTVGVAPLVGACVSAVAVWTIRMAWPPQSLPSILTEGAVVGMIYLGALWTLGLDAAVRVRYSTFARRLLSLAAHRRLAAPLA